MAIRFINGNFTIEVILYLYEATKVLGYDDINWLNPTPSKFCKYSILVGNLYKVDTEIINK